MYTVSVNLSLSDYFNQHSPSLLLSVSTVCRNTIVKPHLASPKMIVIDFKKYRQVSVYFHYSKMIMAEARLQYGTDSPTLLVQFTKYRTVDMYTDPLVYTAYGFFHNSIFLNIL